MKKTYTKPYIVVESFQLDAAIASACSKEGKFPLGYGENSCTPLEELPGVTFLGLACQIDVVNNDTVCYHGPIPDTTAMFMNS